MRNSSKLLLIYPAWTDCTVIGHARSPTPGVSYHVDEALYGHVINFTLMGPMLYGSVTKHSFHQGSRAPKRIETKHQKIGRRQVWG